jgi:glycosyltransferase involved in cell wall biosynthesis
VTPAPDRPRLGVFAFHPIQYQVPLYQRLDERGQVRLDVLFLSDAGLEPTMDPGFGQVISWNIDLLSGYHHGFLRTSARPVSTVRRLRRLVSWLRRQDVIVIHGYTSGWMLTATLVCILTRRPYLLRGDSKPQGQSGRRVRGWLRDRLAHLVVSRSAGALTIGDLNSKFYRRFGQDNLYWAPYSVDDRRFAASQPVGRDELLRSFDLPPDQPLIVFVGKLKAIKRPLDLAEAHTLMTRPASVLYVGDGELRAALAAAIAGTDARITGFVNQQEMPAYYQAADVIVLPSEVEPWGLVINEAMAAGVVPVVSANVGAAADLVDGVGRIVPVGDVAALAGALDDVLGRLDDGVQTAGVGQRASRYSLDTTATGFEDAARAIAGSRQR